MSLAKKLVETRILSTVKMRLKRLGIIASEQIEELAFHRGCRHYGQSKTQESPITKEISDTELGVAFLSSTNQYNPRCIRIGVQFISRESSAKKLYIYAKMRSCVHILQNIIESAIKIEPNNSLWINFLLLTNDSQVSNIKKGVLPNWSRFVTQSGITNPFKNDQKEIQWIR